MKPPSSRTSPEPGPCFTFLIHTFYATGHVIPTQAIAKALVERGHRVVWVTAAAQEARVLDTKATFIPTIDGALCDNKLESESPTKFEECIEQLFGGRLLSQVADLRRVLKDENLEIDCLLNDVCAQGAMALFELGEIPRWATLSVIPFFSPDCELKSSSVCGIMLSTPELLLPCINSQRTELGLPSLLAENTQSLHYSPFLHLVASCPSLEFHRKVPETTHFVGPLIPSGDDQNPISELPAWWSDVVSHSNVVAITQGTFAVDPFTLIFPAIEALCDEEDLLLVVLSPLASLISERLTLRGLTLKSTRIAPWVPYDLLLPKCRLLITNGGYGSVTQALALGVPLICAGASEDKKDTAARVSATGTGIDLGTDTPSVDQIRKAVRCVMSDKSFVENASTIGRELSQLGGAQRACNLLEEMIKRHKVSG